MFWKEEDVRLGVLAAEGLERVEVDAEPGERGRIACETEKDNNMNTLT